MHLLRHRLLTTPYSAVSTKVDKAIEEELTASIKMLFALSKEMFLVSKLSGKFSFNFRTM